MLDNFIKAPFNQSNSQNCLKQKQQTLSHSQTRCANTKIDSRNTTTQTVTRTWKNQKMERQKADLTDTNQNAV